MNVKPNSATAHEAAQTATASTTAKPSSAPLEPQSIIRRQSSTCWAMCFFIPCLLIAIGDLWSKAAVFASTQTHLINGHPEVTFAAHDYAWWIVPAWNTGVAWSLFEKNPFFIVVLTATLIPILIFTYFRWYRQQHWAVDCAFGMVIGGALANAYDRFMTPLSAQMFGVRDFLAFTIPIIDYRWPTFNLADAGISVGFVILLLASFVQERQSARRRKDSTA